MEITIRNTKLKIDRESLCHVERYPWRIEKNKNCYYFVCKNKGIKLYLHRVITGAGKGEHVDHANHDSFDLRKKNLRICTPAENNRNRTSKSKTGYKGVQSVGSKFRAVIQMGGVFRQIGICSSASDAAKMYDKEAEKMYGEFALTNKKMGLVK